MDDFSTPHQFASDEEREAWQHHVDIVPDFVMAEYFAAMANDAEEQGFDRSAIVLRTGAERLMTAITETTVTVTRIPTPDDARSCGI